MKSKLSSLEPNCLIFTIFGDSDFYLSQGMDMRVDEERDK